MQPAAIILAGLSLTFGLEVSHFDSGHRLVRVLAVDHGRHNLVFRAAHGRLLLIIITITTIITITIMIIIMIIIIVVVCIAAAEREGTKIKQQNTEAVNLGLSNSGNNTSLVRSARGGWVYEIHQCLI